jgi:hypothetical protein
MLKNLAPGDVVTVTRIDRLARSTFDLFAIVKQIVDAKAQFRSLAEPWADTGTSTGRLMIAVLGGLADVERDLIRTRTAEGRSRAQKRGQHMGRPSKLTDAQKAEARRRRAEGATLAELARSYDVGKSTISRVPGPRRIGRRFTRHSRKSADSERDYRWGCGRQHSAHAPTHMTGHRCRRTFLEKYIRALKGDPDRECNHYRFQSAGGDKSCSKRRGSSCCP